MAPYCQALFPLASGAAEFLSVPARPRDQSQGLWRRCHRPGIPHRDNCPYTEASDDASPTERHTGRQNANEIREGQNGEMWNIIILCTSDLTAGVRHGNAVVVCCCGRWWMDNRLNHSNAYHMRIDFGESRAPRRLFAERPKKYPFTILNAFYYHFCALFEFENGFCRTDVRTAAFSGSCLAHSEQSEIFISFLPRIFREATKNRLQQVLA